MNDQTLRTLRTAGMLLADVQEGVDDKGTAGRVGTIIEQLDAIDDELAPAS